MPVWHERTKEAREAGELALIGITEEQHPDRCQLFAQWQRFDWPILWDPFNLTESSAVPVAIGIDEHGIVRAVGMTVEQFDEFMATSFDAGGGETRSTLPVRKEARGPRVLDASAVVTPREALSRLLWSRGEDGEDLSAVDFQTCIRALERAAAQGDDPSASFRLGVARRLRYDSSASVPEDFQASLDLWMAALGRDPSQYIWRRRIQQWGPRLDKPYPFYGWIEQAAQEIRERGDTPVELQVSLTSSEVSGRDPVRAGGSEAKHPDPEHKVPRDTDHWVSIDVAVVPHTGDRGDKSAQGVQVHLALRPSSKLDVHWGNDAGPAQVWIDEAVNAGLERQGFTLPTPDAPVSAEPRCLDFTVGTSTTVQTLRGTAFYFVCEGRQGQCRFLAQDFEIALSTKR